ncbi:trypsin-like serine peptidase [Cognatishimia maritima]|uniref:Trypsin n=1 Tax=Cognatishimia maritima TaxID=870908 RepID=A0A1M5N312_9RHOB|nr:trypsin-like serine protease [Cognatishimia maritima]SHG83931.1 Trypsin [Cognatishimia maritima]
MLRTVFSLFMCLLTAGIAGAQAQEQTLMSGVGRLDMARAGFCTATVVSPGVVLTAAHCLFDKQTGKRFATTDLTFRKGLGTGDAAGATGVRAVFMHPDYAFARQGELTNLRYDIALLKLDAAATSQTVSARHFAAPKLQSGNAMVVSYGKGRADSPEIEKGCALTQHAEGVILTTCHARLGTSGAPVYQMHNGQPKIVSIVSAMARADGTPVALVIPVADAVADMHRALTRGVTQATFQR